MKLSEILSHLLRYAEEHPGEKQSTRLPNGLGVDIKVDKGSKGSTHLQIHRSSVYPSQAEWTTVLRHWPYPINVEARPTLYKGRHYLIAWWPTPPRMDLTGNVCAQTQDGER